MTRVPVLLLNVVLVMALTLVAAAVVGRPHDLPPIHTPTVSVLLTQEPPEYAPGKYCTPSGNIVNGRQTADNPCSCHRVTYSKDCEGQAHDAHCLQWCHEEKHCACPVACEMPPPGDDVDCPM